MSNGLRAGPRENKDAEGVVTVRSIQGAAPR